MRTLLTSILLFASTLVNSRDIDTLVWIKVEYGQYNLFYTGADRAEAADIAGYINRGMETVSRFFNKEFRQKPSVFIFPDRSSLTRQWRMDWQLPDFDAQCWMVASGTARRLDLLSPRNWLTEACDHPGDSNEVRQVILHELVHVLHGQYNPHPDFTNMEKLDWLVEGLATYASGQLTQERVQRIKNSFKEGTVPVSFAELWKGADKYGKAGSFIRYLDQLYGRQKLTDLMQFSDPGKLLNYLDSSEKQLLEGWVRFTSEK